MSADDVSPDIRSIVSADELTDWVWQCFQNSSVTLDVARRTSLTLFLECLYRTLNRASGSNTVDLVRADLVQQLEELTMLVRTWRPGLTTADVLKQVELGRHRGRPQ